MDDGALKCGFIAELLYGVVLQGCVSLAEELCSEVPPISKATMTDAQSQSDFLYDIHSSTFAADASIK